MPTTIHQRRWRVNFSQEALAKMFTDSRGLSSDGEAYLVLRDNQTWRDVYRLDPAVAHSIGRDETNEFVLNDHRCSRRHCSIQRVDGEWTIQDLDSRNGTAVNGIKIPAQQYLGDGDIIRVGRTQFLFTCDLTQRFADDYGGDDSGEEEETSHDSDSEDASSSDSSVADDPQIVEVQGNSGLFSEGLVNSDDEGLRRAFSNLYKLIARLVSAPTVPALCEVVLDEVCAALDVEMGAVLLFPPGHDDPTDVDELRILAYHAPQGAPYQKVSTRLSRAALKQRQGVLAMDVGRHTEFQTLHDLKAQSVVCAPIQTDDYLFGLLHLYSLRAEQPLDTESLAFAVAVTEQTAASLVRLNQRDLAVAGFEYVQDENHVLRRMLEIESDLVGRSDSMQRLRDTIARVAASDATALVRGESGVGKELVARAIHFNSDRKEGPFVCLNCAALSENLLESELFGHERGSFTGATERKIGKFEHAHQGTLFLDEVGEMPLAIQAKFLRALEGQPFERVGGNENIHVDVRVVAATNRDLEQAVEASEFRNDLFYRLQILEILAPPLREHAGDIAELANHFLLRCCERLGRTGVSLSKDALRELEQFDWPGNVRELRNVIERAVVLADGPEIQPDDISLRPTSSRRSAATPSNYRPRPLEEMEREHIEATLRWTKWHKREAARILDINRSTLDRKLERYEIEPPDPS